MNIRIATKRTALTAVAIGIAGCQLVTLIDRDRIAGTDPGTGGQGASSCSEPADCEGTDGECGTRTCVDSTCGFDLVSEGTPCTQDNGTVCDGDGSCVACIDDNQCMPMDVCDTATNECVGGHCTNMTTDDTETDVDCGGPDCDPCTDGMACAVFSDCESGFCDNSVCAGCMLEADCQSGTHCDNATTRCVPDRPQGAACLEGRECESGDCVDGFCCETACFTLCVACNIAGSEGTCAAIPAGTDPDNECGADECGGNGQCRCQNGMMDGSETDTDCGGGTCPTCGAGDMCMNNTDCTSNVCLGNMTCQ